MSELRKKLKIAIVNKFFFIKGGQESLVFSEAEMLQQEGHEVGFFSMKHPHNNEYKYDKYFTDYVEFSNLGNEYSLLKKIKIALNFVRNKNSAIKFEAFVNDFKPDIIHCHGIAHQITPTILPIARKYRIPIVQTLHDKQLICPSYSLLLKGEIVCHEMKCCKGNYLHCVVNKCVKHSYLASILSAVEMRVNVKMYSEYIDKFITPSMFLNKIILKSGIKKEKIVHIPNSIDVISNIPVYENNGYFIYVGRLSFEKGLLTLLKAFKGIPSASLKIIGTGPQELEIKKYREENKINNVELLGTKTKDELIKYYSECIAVVLPSECFENAPMCIIESFSYGKPVIASNIGGIPEMIIDHYNGVTFEAGNSLGLIMAVRRFLENKDLSRILGENARKTALEKYTRDIHFKKLISLYKSLIEVDQSDRKENEIFS